MEKRILLSEKEYDDLLMYKKMAGDGNGFVYLLKETNSLGMYHEYWYIYSKEDFEPKLKEELNELSRFRMEEERRSLKMDCKCSTGGRSGIPAYWRTLCLLFAVLFVYMLILYNYA